jgi:hypothetical protein
LPSRLGDRQVIFEMTRMLSYDGPVILAMGENHHFSMANKVEKGE